MMKGEDMDMLRALLREIRVKAWMALRCANADASGKEAAPVAIGNARNGIILDGRAYEAVPFQHECRGCDLFKRCAGGRAYLCEFMDKVVGSSCMFRAITENEKTGKDGQD